VTRVHVNHRVLEIVDIDPVAHGGSQLVFRDCL
jgi:hypothetical protein